MAAVVLLRGALGLLGVISQPDDNAWLEITTLGNDDGNPASKMFKGHSDGGAAAAAGGGGQGKQGGAQPRPGTAAARAAGVTEATPLLGAGSVAPAFEGIRPKAASKDEDRACPHTLLLMCKGHCTPRPDCHWCRLDSVADAAPSHPHLTTGLYWIDNARYWLETFVIMKHTMVYVGTLYTWNTWWQPGLASFFETFMMPMFCACSGYLSKGTPTADRCLRVVFRAWVPFVIVNIFYSWIDGGWTSLGAGYNNVLDSLEVSWFLCCWIQWRLMLPYICSMPPSVAILVAYMLSWFSGYWFDSEPTFHQDEVLGFFPYVVTGYVVQLEHIKALDKPWIRRVSAGTFWCLFVGTMTFAKVTYLGPNAEAYNVNHFNIYNYYWMTRDYNRSYYYGEVDNAATTPGYWSFWTVRAVGQLITWTFGLAFFGMVPHTKQVYSEWGCNTIYPYCLQVWYLRLLSDLLHIVTGVSTIPVHVWYATPMWALNFAVVPFANAAMASRFTRKWTCFVFNPTWAMRPLMLVAPDKFTEADCQPDMLTHAISFTGFIVATLLILWLSGGVACIKDAEMCGHIPTELVGVHQILR
jgi:fucose 4-O-acetylase-like acetyltransferase